MASPLGRLLIVCDGEGLCALEYEGRQPWFQARYHDLSEYRSRLQAYFDGDYAALDGIQVSLRGTPFQKRVWTALRAIPAGTTASYGEIAAKLGPPSVARAVGQANSRNPVAIVVPCHRVVGAGGSLTGYSGGLERKRWLLAHEGVRR
jgi:methylated-DNA-[protein]-cysteine S-methyltransferase